jgi:hypothetical protein
MRIIIHLYYSSNTVWVIKTRRMRWAGHLACMGERRGFWWGNVSERKHLECPRVNGRMILKWIFRKWDVGVWTGSIWLRIATGGGHL